MVLNITNKEVDRDVRKLAKLTGKSLKDAVHDAVLKEIDRVTQAEPLSKRLRGLSARLDDYAPTGKTADKAFFDDLTGS